MLGELALGGPDPRKIYGRSEYVVTPKNVTFFHSTLLLDNSASFIHIMKDERLASKMEGKTNFTRRLYRLSGTGDW